MLLFGRTKPKSPVVSTLADFHRGRDRAPVSNRRIGQNGQNRSAARSVRSSSWLSHSVVNTLRGGIDQTTVAAWAMASIRPGSPAHFENEPRPPASVKSRRQRTINKRNGPGFMTGAAPSRADQQCSVTCLSRLLTASPPGKKQAP